MKVLVLANNDIGLYNFRKELLQSMISMGWKVVLSFPDGERRQDLVNLGCEFVDTPVNRRGENIFEEISLLVKYFKICKYLNPDIVLTYTIKPNIYGGLVCRFLRIPYLTNITGLGTSLQKNGIKKILLLKMYKYSLNKSECIFFQNNDNYIAFMNKKINGKKQLLIPGSGINLEEHRLEDYPDESIPITFLFIGRLMRAKGIEEYLEAAEKITEDFTQVKFQIIGNYEEDYATQINDLVEKGVIEYFGFQKDVHEFVKNCSAVIMPSYHEGLSNVLLEAAACGRPIIASNISGCVETFDEGISGLGFVSGNVESLIIVIKHFLLLSYQKKKEMGIKGRQKMEREFNRKIVIEMYINEIMRLCKEDMQE